MHDGQPETGDDGQPYTVVGYLNGTGTILREDMNRTGICGALDQETTTYRHQVLVPRPSETHSGEDVAVYAKGPYAHLLNGTIEQNFIFHVVRRAAIR